MRAGRIMVAVAAAAIVASCGGGFARLGTYGMKLADANIRVDGTTFALHVHPTEDTILVQRGFGAAMGNAFVEGATFGAVRPQEPKPVWQRAAEWLTGPAGCTVTDVYELENISWEATYTCPSGVDLRAIVAANRSALRQGQPLPPQAR